MTSAASYKVASSPNLPVNVTSYTNVSELQSHKKRGKLGELLPNVVLVKHPYYCYKTKLLQMTCVLQF